MSALNTYYKFNPNLVNSLPMKDAMFMSKMVQKGLFVGNIKANVKAQPTDADAAEYFLDNVIERSLNNDNTELFVKLLEVMEGFSPQLRTLAGNIRKELSPGGGGSKVSAGNKLH